MSRKFTPKINKKKQLDDFVHEASKTPENSTQNERESKQAVPQVPAQVERKQHGYLIRKDYIKKIAYLSATLDKKKWEVLEDALTAYFEEHKELISKLES